MRWILCLSMCIVFVACGGEDNLQPPMQEVELTVTVTPSPADPQHPAAITAEAVNATMERRDRYDGCGLWGQGMTLEILDPESQVVYLWDPTVVTLCPVGEVPFEPGQHVHSAARFDGQLFTETGTPFMAPTGTYTVVVRFETRRHGETPRRDVAEQRTTFEWHVE